RGRQTGAWETPSKVTPGRESVRESAVALQSRSLGLWSRGADDADGLASPLGTEFDGTGGRREQRVVATTTDVDAGVEVGAALADQDLAGLDDLATEPLDAEPLSVRIATVA